MLSLNRIKFYDVKNIEVFHLETLELIQTKIAWP